MMEERTRFEVLLENIQTSVNVIAEGHVALVERLDRSEPDGDAHPLLGAATGVEVVRVVTWPRGSV